MAPNKTHKPKNNNRPAKDSRKKVAPKNNKESNRGRFSSMFSKETNATNNLNPQDGKKQKGEQPATTEESKMNELAVEMYKFLKKLKKFGLLKILCISLLVNIKKVKKFPWASLPLFPEEKLLLPFVDFFVILLIVLFFLRLFLNFNHISHDKINIEVDYLKDYRYLTKDNDNDSLYTLHFQSAELYVEIPRQFIKKYIPISGKYTVNHSDGKMKIVCNEDTAGLHLKSNLTPYWHLVYYHAAKKSNYNPVYRYFSNLQSRQEFIRLKKIFPNDSILLTYYDTFNKLARNDTINAYEKVNYYRSKLSCDVKHEPGIKDATWIKEIDNGDTLKYIRLNNEIIDSTKYIALETYNRIIHPYWTFVDIEDMDDSYNTVEVIDTLNYHWDYWQSIKGSLFNHKGFSMDALGRFDEFDISRGWYHISLKSASIDSINLCLDFLGSTEFTTPNIVPDEIGGSYIKYTDQNKILQIKNEGLSFFAKHKELENQQSIRIILVTAFLSGLLVTLLTFYVNTFLLFIKFILIAILDSLSYILRKIAKNL